MSSTGATTVHPELTSNYVRNDDSHDTSRNSVDIPQLQLFQSIRHVSQPDKNHSPLSSSETSVKPDWPVSKAMFLRASTQLPWITRACRSLWSALYTPDGISISKERQFDSGTNLIDRLLQFNTNNKTSDRLLTSGVWQVLLEESAIGVCCSLGQLQQTEDVDGVIEFEDSPNKFYRCCCPMENTSGSEEETTDACIFDVIQSSVRKKDNDGVSVECLRTDSIDNDDTAPPSSTSEKNNTLPLRRGQSGLLIDRLYGLASDAVFRRLLLRPSDRRTNEELEFIQQELLLIPAVGQLPCTVRTELSKCLHYEVHPVSGRVIFRQGDPGSSWYIIHRGSVLVHVEGQGYVCRLSEGDDFGKLALITGAPRAASIVLAENSCHFLRVDREDFDRILVDVEANFVRLKEQDSDVLILERVVQNHSDALLPAGSSNNSSSNGVSTGSFDKPIVDNVIDKPAGRFINHSIVAGTEEKILQHILEVRLGVWENHLALFIDESTTPYQLCPSVLHDIDQVVEEFFLTMSVYMSPQTLFAGLIGYIRNGRIVIGSEKENSTQDQITRSSVERCIDVHCLNRVVAFLYLWSRCYGLSQFAVIPGVEDFLRRLCEISRNNPTARIQQQALERLTDDCTNLWTVTQNLETRSIDIADEKSPRPLSHRKPSPRSGNHGLLLSGARGRFGRSRTQDSSTRPALIKQQSRSNDPISGVQSHLMACYQTRYRIEPATLPLSSALHTVTLEIYMDSTRQPKLITVPMHCTVTEIKRQLCEQIPSLDTNLCVMVEVQSKGERIIHEDTDRAMTLGLIPNSCLFFVPRSRVPSLSPLPVQLRVAMNYLDSQPAHFDWVRGGLFETHGTRPSSGGSQAASPYKPLDDFNLHEIACLLTFPLLQLAICVGPREFLDYTRGDKQSVSHGAPHIQLLVTHFTLVHAWTITQIVTTPVVARRAQLVKKFIKLADRLICMPYCDQHTCFAIVLALSSSPVSRLQQTWERVPQRWRRVFHNRLVPLVDPARNHRAARNWLLEHVSGCVPFVALILKDLRFTEDANKTLYPQNTGSVRLINFEKMRLLARTLHMWNKAIAGFELLHPQLSRMQTTWPKIDQRRPQHALFKTLADIVPENVSQFYQNFECIDDSSVLMKLSHRLEPKRA